MTSVALVTFVAALVLAAWTTARDHTETSLAVLLDDIVEAGAPGALVSMRDSDGPRVAARGYSDLDNGVKMRADDRFRIGSVTKTFVATLVLLLAEDGLLDLDDSVERWLPGLLPAGRKITLRQLLSHTSGLFDYVEDARIRRQPERRWTPEELVSIALDHPPERTPPGAGYAYSSTNYILLGLIAERAGGAPLGRLLRARVLGPLGLPDTSFVPGVVGGGHVHGHRSPAIRAS